MKKFERPEMEIDMFSAKDIVASSADESTATSGTSRPSGPIVPELPPDIFED